MDTYRYTATALARRRREPYVGVVYYAEPPHGRVPPRWDVQVFSRASALRAWYGETLASPASYYVAAFDKTRGPQPVGEWTAPVIEPEIAVHLARDVGPGASWDEVRAAIRGLSAAIELADVDTPPADPEAILAGNIFHRHVILGPVVEGRSQAAGVTGRLLRDGEEVAATDAPETLTGELIEVVRLTAELLEAAGERLRAGDVVITGSVVAPLAVAGGQRLRAELAGLGALTVALV